MWWYLGWLMAGTQWAGIGAAHWGEKTRLIMVQWLLPGHWAWWRRCSLLQLPTSTERWTVTEVVYLLHSLTDITIVGDITDNSDDDDDDTDTGDDGLSSPAHMPHVSSPHTCSGHHGHVCHTGQYRRTGNQSTLKPAFLQSLKKVSESSLGLNWL